MPGQRGATWHDPLQRHAADPRDPFGARSALEAAAALQAFARDAFPHLDRRDVFLGGFSMGGTAAALAAFCDDDKTPLGGVLLLAAALDAAALGLAAAFAAPALPPCFLAVGADDARCPPDRVRASDALLRDLGVAAHLREYAGLAHAVSTDMVRDAARFVHAQHLHTSLSRAY